MMRMIRSMEAVGPLVEIIAAIGVGMALLYVYMANLSVGRFFGLISGIFILYDSIKTLSRIHLVMQRSMAATTSIFSLLDSQPTVQDAPDAVALSSSQGRIDFEDVTFRYDNTVTDAISDQGCLLSGRQQQRLSIARDMLKNAPILVLDEATSSLDSESEQQIQRALAELATGRTVIAIAHRLSTVLSADQIIVMDGGRIKEIGTHAELLDKSGYYRRLYDHQFNRVHKESDAEAGILVEELV